ncbi:Nucleolar protein 6 [Amphibalanus amphitrite]|uniref:Nucleolar protein 6 n=1 Tax=Amphibalanus amphitrite TaxID=1232801 RepID=A0A6A4VC49_AMPAM|nr:Nucleolar protein 6 [Amphibalanus amphitrite]
MLPIEPLLPARAPPWEVAACPHVTFSLDIGALRRDAPPDELHQAAQRHLASLPQQAIWVWTDGSADAGVRSGGAGAFVEWPDGATDELRVPAGQLCSSFRAEMVTLRAALNHLRDHPHQPSAPITICSDSQSALATLREGPASQKTLLGAAIWTELAALAGPSRRIHLQWVPSHCGVDGNERADQIAKEATALPQAAVPVDVATAHRAAARLARDRTIAAWPEGWYRTLMENRLPPPAATGDRSSAVDVYLGSAPLPVPQQPSAALLRWLRLLAHTDWRQQPLLVRLNDELSAEQQAPLLARFRTERDRLPALVVFTPYDETGTAWTHERPTAVVLQHVQKLASSAHDLLTAQLSASPDSADPLSDWRAIFRPPLEAFDIRIRLRRKQIPRRHQAVDPAGKQSRADPYSKHPYEAVPAAEFDPVQRLVAELRAAAAGWALVCHDRCGGDVIGVVVRPDALRPRPLAAFRCEGDMPAGRGGAEVAPNVAGFVDLARTLGGELVEHVELEADRLTAMA